MFPTDLQFALRNTVLNMLGDGHFVSGWCILPNLLIVFKEILGSINPAVSATAIPVGNMY